MPTIRITQPGCEPITLAEAKAHLRVDHEEEDGLIGIYISTAREMAEGELQRALITSTWLMQTDGFSPALRLDWPRVQAVETLQFVDTAGVLQTLDPQDYRLDAASDCGPAWLVPAPGCAWPATAAEVNAVQVRYRAGYGDYASDVPQPIRSWMLLHIADLYANREATGRKAESLPYLSRLLDPYRVW